MKRSIPQVVLFLSIGLSVLIASYLSWPAYGQAPSPSDDRPQVLSPAWEIGEQDLAAREYWVTWQERTAFDLAPAAWHAPNRAQGLRSFFLRTGVHVVSRTTSPVDWTWGLSLVGYGRGDKSQTVEQASLFPDENRIQLDRRRIEEWFVNEPRGLKHGFVLHVQPVSAESPTAGAREVHLDLAVSGNLTPVLETGGRSVRFAGPSGLGTIYYRGLEVQDARGHALPARMELVRASGAQTLRLLIDDSGAVYPLTVDPLTTTAAWIAESDQVDAKFGCSLGIAGDVNGDGYDDILVGAYEYDNGEADEGAAFLFLGSASGPSSTHDWMVEGNEADAWVGRPIVMTGDVNGDGYDDVIVGARGLDNGDKLWGFHGSATGLSAIADWVGHPAYPEHSSYGRAAGAAGDVNGDGYDDVIVGEPEGPGFGLYSGRAYLYRGSASGLWPDPHWIDTGAEWSEFGWTVSTAGDVNGDGYDDVVVGAPLWEAGRAFVYHGAATGLSQAPVKIFEGDETTRFGQSVSTAGDVNRDGYDDVIVGAPGHYDATPPGPGTSGKAYVYHGSASGLGDTPNWEAEFGQFGGAGFGRQVESAGDVNGDGYDDVLVGAIYYDGAEVDEGAVWLYLGSESGLTLEPSWMVEGLQEDGWFGWIAGGGDVNGDGADDVIVGAMRHSNGEEEEGRAYLYLGAQRLTPAGWVPDDAPLQLLMLGETTLALSWEPSCLAGDVDFEVYEGQIGDFTSHRPVLCSTGGQTSAEFEPDPGSTYYLVVPRSQNGEGSYGRTSAGEERPPGKPACLLQSIGDC